MTRVLPLAIALVLALGGSACGRGGGAQSGLAAVGGARTAEPFDREKPAGSLLMDADEAARRLGSFEWTGGVEWTVSREGNADRVHAVERHRLVQAATGEFLVEDEVDPGLGDGSQSGREVIWSGGMTFARARWAPWRERPTDHGRDAKRYRAESFNLGADLGSLIGPRLSLASAGDATFLGRTAVRYAISLASDVPERTPVAETRAFPQGGPDEDTKVRLAFLDGAQPVSAKGELLLDAQTGTVLRLSLDAAFGVKADPRARVQASLRTQLKALGAGVPSVVPPKALPDERKPRGVADALERAGLKKKAEAEKKEPGDDAEP